MLTSSGAQVFPGDVLFRQEGTVKDVTAVRGCRLVLRNSKRARVEGEDTASPSPSSSDDTLLCSVVVATIAGKVQYEGGSISVVRDTGAAAPAAAGSSAAPPAPSTSSAAIVTPSAESKVLLRVQRASRHMVQGTIIAVVSSGGGETQWCYNNTVGGFRGSLRSEDIRPVVNKNDVDAKLLASFPASSVTSSGAVVLPAYASYRPGDIVVATVSSQTDTKQFQLSTLPEDTGCIDAFSLRDKTVKLSQIPNRRDAMFNAKTGETESKWCPK